MVFQVSCTPDCYLEIKCIF